MRFRVYSCALLFVFATSVLAAVKPTGENVPNEVLIKLRENAAANALAGIEKQVDGQAKQIAKLRSGKLLRLRSRTRNVEALTQALSHNPHIEYVEPNAIIRLSAEPNDSLYPQLYGLENTGQNIAGVNGIPGADIDAEAAWNVTTGSHSVVVGVVDTGIDYNHPDLAANVWSNPGGAGNPDCAAGTHGFNAINGTCNPADDEGHGTHTAGTIGAVGNNGLGVTGVNWNVSIMGLKFLNQWGSGTTADAVEAIDFAIQAKIDGVNVRVLSNSWGGGSFSKALLDVINEANANDILFVASAGNSGISTDSFPQYPAGYATPNMISVAATDNRDALAYFSNYGTATVHLAAPGVNVISTVPNGGYSSNSGTSMAAPHVSGVAALVLAANPGFTTAQVKSAILNSTDPVPALAGRVATGGRLNAAGAVGGTPSPDYRLIVSPSARTVAQGAAGAYTITINRSNGFTGAVALSVSGLPTGATASFNPASVTGTTATLLVTTSASTPQNTWQLTITGTSGAMTRTTTAALLVASMQPGGACPTFTAGTNFSMNAPTSVAIADFNRNGRADTAVSDAMGNVVAVRMDGSSSGISYGVGKAPLGVAAGDFNRDGRPDLVTANSASNDVSILLANASGFATAVHYGAGTSPFHVAAADFDRDGNLDLAVANNGEGNVSVLLGNGDGTFDAAVDYTTGSGPYWVTTADFDGNGTQDLAVANFNAGTVSVLLGNGDGTFEPADNTTVGTKPSGVVAADFDGNGRVDLATSNYGSNNASLLLGDGDGTFAAAVHFAVGLAPHSIDAGDLDGNGKPDLVVANVVSSNVSILMANGYGSFASALSVGTTWSAAQARLGDLDSDGKPDMVVITQDLSRVLYMYNTSNCTMNCGNFGAATAFSAGSTPDSTAAGDLNGDGRLDLAIVDSASNNIAIRLGNGDGTFTTGTSVAAGTSPHGVAIGDLNGDGKLDLVSASTDSNQAVVLLGNGDGTFQNAVAYATNAAPRSVAIGDFNRDGNIDLVLPARDANTVSVLLGAGDGTFLAAVHYAVGTGPRAVAVGDFNRDGLQDLAVANAGSANVSILQGNADGTFQAAVNVTVGTTPRSLVAGDLNRDGRLDLAVANAGSHDVSILLGNGDGTFGSPGTVPVGTQPLGIVAGDFNADGRLDLATANINSHDVSLLISLDAGVFAPAVSLPAGGLGPTALVAADFDRDGKSDLATMNIVGASFSMLLNRCPLPDLTVAKTHGGTFTQGGTGNYTITVSNAGALATTAGVSVTDTLPTGLAATAISGSGWTCSLATLSCSRQDALAAGASYPPITLSVRVHSGAPLNVTNTVYVSGGGEINVLNNNGSDPTSIVPMTDLLITKTHTGAFAQGATGRTYKIVVRNAGGLATSGTVTMADTLPTGLTATALSGSGWSCNVGSLTCTRSDALAGSTSYPTITLTVNVAADAPSLVVNTATVSGGGDASPANNTASDPTIVWSSNTCGSFAIPAYYGAVTSAATLEIGDFNADGHSDMVTSGGYPGNYSVLLGAGNGTFAAAVEYAARYPTYLTSGDLDQDGDIDLVSVSDESDSVVQVHLGIGNGTFAAPVTYDGTTAAYMHGAELADLDRDGDLDFLTRESWNVQRAIVFLGNGDGTLQTPAFFTIPSGVQGWAVSDVDADTALDLLLVAGTSFHVMRGNGDGTFQAAVEMNLHDGSLYGVAAGDFNGDGKMDAAVTHWSRVKILIGQGDGTFTFGDTYDTTSSATYLTLADINADGNLDLLTTSSYGSIATLRGNGDGTFQNASSYYVGDAGISAVGDFNEDGRADVAFTDYWHGRIGVMLGGCPDLEIKKTHYGDFFGGQTGSYTITVKNVGGGGIAGPITVQDILPSGMTATSMFGYPAFCSLDTLTCTYNGTLPTGSSFSINLYVNISSTAATSVTNVATVSAAGDTNPSNNSASDPTTIVHAADLLIKKTHAGNVWAPGQTGVYTITVGNIGTGPTVGTVTVQDMLPSQMSAISMTGTGWNCNAATRTCTRSDALAATAVYPPITLTVSVVTGGEVSNVATVSGGGDPISYNNSSYDYTRIFTAPTNVVATSTSSTHVTVTWYSGLGTSTATQYEIFRAAPGAAYAQVGTTLSPSFIDSSAAPNTPYLYKVRMVESGTLSPFSNADYTTTRTFTDDPVVPRSTRIKRTHIEELRQSVNAVRQLAGMTTVTWTDSSLVGVRIKKVHITDLRNALNEMRTYLGMLWFPYNDSTAIKAQHITELRTSLR